MNANCDLKICDFGLSRVFMNKGAEVSDDKENFMTLYVTTRYVF